VIFYDITGFQRRGFLQIISINHRFSDIWLSGMIHLNAALKIHPLNSLLDSSQKTPENLKI